MRIAVLGAGAWGTALAIAFAARHEVALWGRDAARIDEMARLRANSRYLPGCPFPPGLRVTAGFADALDGVGLAILAGPLAGLRELLERLKAVAPETPFLWVCKGLEAGSGLLPHQVVAEVMGRARCGVLTGPSFALEVARGLPTAITLAAVDAEFAAATANALHGGNLRIYANEDLVGAEVGGAVKNVLAHQQPDHRHDHVIGHRRDDLAEGGPDDDADGEVHDIATQGKGLEFLQHDFPFH